MRCQELFTHVERSDRADAVRIARPDDLASLVALDRLCFGERAWSPTAWWEAIVDPLLTTLVLADGGGIVAATVLLVAAPVSALASIAVHPEHRRRGLGTLLLGDALARSRRARARWLTLDVDADNHEAIRLYRRAGFAIVRRFREDGRARREMIRRFGRCGGSARCLL